MGVKDMTKSEATALEGTRHEVARFEYPIEQLSPYYTWLRNFLRYAGRSSAGWFRVHESDAADDQIYVAPGRAVIDGVLLAYNGADVDLAAHQNDTAYVWLYNNGGSAAIGFDADGNGWPDVAHIKLAEVALTTEVDSITDRRHEWMLRHETHPTYSLSINSQGDTGSASRVHIQLEDSDGRTIKAQDIIRVRVCDDGGWSDATNATIAVAGSTTKLADITTTKDLVIESDANGLFELDLTDATAETVMLRIGPAPLTARDADYTPTLDVTHAAP